MAVISCMSLRSSYHYSTTGKKVHAQMSHAFDLNGWKAYLSRPLVQTHF